MNTPMPNWGLLPKLIDVAAPQLALLIAFLFVFCSRNVQGETRLWKDATGKFSVQAELIEQDDAQVILKKSDGEQIAVPLAKLSDADRAYLQTLAQQQDQGKGVTLGKARTYRVRVGMEMSTSGTATGLVGIVPIPIEWPEQTVRIVEEEKTPQVGRVTYRNLEDGARQMMISVPKLRRGETARATVTYEVRRHGLVGPEATDEFRIPQRPGRDLRHYLQSGPLTNAKDASIIAAKDKAIDSVEGAWNQVRAIHDWVLDNVRYQERPEIKTAGIALQEGMGDCQELSSLFVAMCRAHGVPARCVWIPRHSYAEFYLEDANGRGHWFPVESTNKEQFGFLPRTEIILQKGDNFKVPEYAQPLHYARTIVNAAHVKCFLPKIRRPPRSTPIDE